SALCVSPPPPTSHTFSLICLLIFFLNENTFQGKALMPKGLSISAAPTGPRFTGILSPDLRV
ncbi:MAG: hypothetical protein V2B18_24620, partial [Pseudomonadota bacterium]